jgi:TPR repeat protein
MDERSILRRAAAQLDAAFLGIREMKVSMQARFAAVAVMLIMSSSIAAADAQSDYEAGVAAHDRDDVITAMEFLQKAVDQAHVPAMVRLGYLLDKGEQNQAAFQMYRRAAEAGSAEAALAVGVMYANGEGVPQDNVQALAWLARAAKAGHGPAMVTLAQVHLRGDLEMQPDRGEALRWLEQAVSAGYGPAKLELERLRQSQRNPEKQ